MSWNEDAGAAPTLIDLGATPTANRLVRFAGVPPAAALCTSGADADAVTLAQADRGDGLGLVNQGEGYLAVPGLPVQVESGGAFASGATLQVRLHGTRDHLGERPEAGAGAASRDGGRPDHVGGAAERKVGTYNGRQAEPE